jgi:hypothetical protein
VHALPRHVKVLCKARLVAALHRLVGDEVAYGDT